MAEYGIPYMGSKAKICDELIKIFPKAENFYDLFGGGFSVTHAMLARRSKDFKQFHFNEIGPGINQLIKDAIEGKYNYLNFLPEWISREDFFKRKDSDAIVKILWSFGNNGRNYMFSPKIEPYKRSMHYAVVFNKFDELARQTLQIEHFQEGYSIKGRRLFARQKIEFYRKTKVPEFLWPFLDEKSLAIVKRKNQLQQLQQLQQLEGLERLQQLQQLEKLQQLGRLERLQRLQQLGRLERLQFYNLSYDEIPIKGNSIIYCDPPYAGTAKYDRQFNYKAFFDWCHQQQNPVFISEYEIKDSRLTQIWSINKRSLFSPSGTMNVKQERVYVNQAAFKMLKETGRI